jgi:membrane protease YdiL (CAAX protease family)
MNASLPTARQAFWLLLRLRMRRLVNMSGMLFMRGQLAGKSRPATAGKRGVRVLVTLLMAGFMTAAFISMASGTILNLHCRLDTVARNCAAVHAASGSVLSGAFSFALAQALSLELCVLLLVAIVLPLGSKELAHADWDLEWLVTLPMRRATLLWSRVAERAIGTPTAWLTLWPLCLMIAWHSGYRWAAPLLGLAAAAPLMLIASALRTVVDTGLRLRLPPSQLRNLQALASVAALPLMYFVMSLSMPTASMTMEWMRHAPFWLLRTPPGLVVQALNAPDALAAARFAALYIAQAAVITWACVYVLGRLLANGVVAGGSRETGRKPKPNPWVRPAGSDPNIDASRVRPRGSDPGVRFEFGTPLQRRELRLLSRDRNFLVQSLLLPIIIIGTQLVFNGAIDKAGDLGADPRLLAALAFGIGAYVLMLSAFQTLNREGQSLWMLYTFPRTLESMLKEKAQLWAVLACAYPLAVYAAGLALAAKLDAHLISLIILTLAGIAIFAVIAVSLGVWACDPLAEEATQRVRPTFVYTYFVLTSFYTFALYTQEWHIKLAVIVLMSALALSLWQKARDALPYMLDTTASPPPRVSAADGMMATLLFFAVQLIVLFILHDPGKQPAMSHIAIAFAVAGSITYALARLIYWRTHATGVPRLLPGSGVGQRTLSQAVAWALGLSVVAIGFAAGYLAVLRHLAIALPTPHGSMWIYPLAILAAPLFEEFIFRGQIFGGLRRSMPLAAAMTASAAIFAVIHPPVSMLPVFVLGLCTAWTYERTKSLLAPMLTHALYNGAMLALQS